MKETFFPTLALALCLFAFPVTAQNFNGYPCTVDCSGHEAGYEWAEEKGIEDESDCGGNSNSFIEGCQSYVEEQEEDNQSNNLLNDENTSDDYKSDY